MKILRAVLHRFLLRFLLPYRVELVKQTNGLHYAGYKRVYVFGVLVAEIQKTEPWR